MLPCRGSSLRRLPWLVMFFMPALLVAVGLVLSLPAPAAHAATHTVCSSGADYTTIQAAVNAATPGDVIEICNGTYAESVSLSSMGTRGNITLRGSGTVVISPAAGPALMTTAPFPGGVALENLSLTSPDSNAANFAPMLGGDLSLTGVSVTNANAYGIEAIVGGAAYISATSVYSSGLVGADLTVAYSVHITNSTFSYNGVAMSGSGLALVAGGGLACGAADAITLSGVRADHNVAHGIFGRSYNSAAAVTSSMTNYNQGGGIVWVNEDGCDASTQVDRVVANSNGINGIDLSGSAHVTNATANGNGIHGVSQHPVQVSQAAASGVTPAGGNAGMGPGYPLTGEISNTTASNNGIDGIHFEQVDIAIVRNVSANGNTRNGIYLPVSSLIPMVGAANANASQATWAEVANSLITKNGVGVAIEDVTLPFAAASNNNIPGATVNLHDSMVCSNTLGVASTGNISGTYGALYNTWGPINGPYNALRNPTGSGNGIKDGDSGQGQGYVEFSPWLDTWFSYVNPNQLIVGGDNDFFAYLLGSGGMLREGPGNLNDTPPFTLTASSGVFVTEFGRGASAPVRFSVGGPITGTLIPDAEGSVTVTVSGPCGDEYRQPFSAVAPNLAVTKSPATQAVLPGGTVTFTVAFTNTGDVPLQNVIVTDTLAPGCSTTVASLDPGASEDVTCSMGPVMVDTTNRVTVTANPQPQNPTAASVNVPPDQVVVTATASAFVDVVQPELTVNKTVGTDPNACAQPGAITVPANTQVYYCLRLTNSGDVTLTDHLISDPLLGVYNVPVAYTLAPHASLPITRSVIPALGPINVTAPITNVYAVTSTGVISEIGGVVVPPVGVSVESAASVVVRTPSTALDVGKEPVGTNRVYLPTLSK